MVLKMLAFFAATSFVAWILLIMGFQTRRESRQRNETEHTRTTGTIVDYARGEHRYGKGGIDVYWKPVVEFIADGQKFHAEYPNRMDKDKTMYCEKCKHIFDGERCPNCRKGRVRQVKPEDPCFLTEKGSPWNGMLEDVLRQNDIPFMTGGRLGAGLSTYVGPVLEVTRFYVCWSDLERANEIVEELFGGGSEE